MAPRIVGQAEQHGIEHTAANTGEIDHDMFADLLKGPRIQTGTMKREASDSDLSNWGGDGWW